MKFKVKEPGYFQHTVHSTGRHVRFEEGNTYDSDVHHLSNAELDLFHQAGWISIPGREEIDRDPKREVILKVHNVTHEYSVHVDGEEKARG